MDERYYQDEHLKKYLDQYCSAEIEQRKEMRRKRRERERKRERRLRIFAVLIVLGMLLIFAAGVIIGNIISSKYDIDVTSKTSCVPSDGTMKKNEPAVDSNIITNPIPVATFGIGTRSYDQEEPQLPPEDDLVEEPEDEEEDISEIAEESEPELPPEPEEIPPTPQEVFFEHLGDDIIETEFGTLKRYELPSYYYGDIDFSSFQSFMPYTAITDRSSQAWKVVHDDRMYVDRYGVCKFTTDSTSEFTIDRHDDFVVALATYYKEKGTCGSRYVIVTTEGAFTVITGDEKSDKHTDSHHMYTTASGNYCGLIEYLVDYSSLTRSIKNAGTVTAGPYDVVKGEILYIYGIIG